MSLNQISVFLENKAGTLNHMTKVLADGGIDLRAISVAEAKDFGIARIIVDNVIAASTVLAEAGFIAKLAPVIACEVPDAAGGLNRLLSVFTEVSVNIEYMYSCLVGKEQKKAYMIFRVEDPARAEVQLDGRGIHVLSQEQLSVL